MWAVLLVAIVVAWMLLKYKETFVIKYGNPFDNEDLVSFDPDAKGTRLFSTTPDTCPEDRPVLDGGLCYPECDPGYHGVGPVCWADTSRREGGIAPDRASCSDMGLTPEKGWRDSGILLCWKDLKCRTSCDISTGRLEIAGTCIIPGTQCEGPEARIKDPKCPGTWLRDIVGGIVGGLGTVAEAVAGPDAAGGATRGVADALARFTDYAEGLCYEPCPSATPNAVPGMPYLCMKGERGLSYGRGAGTPPPLFHFGP